MTKKSVSRKYLRSFLVFYLDDNRVILYILVVHRGNELNVIGIDYTSLNLGSEVGVDGVYDVAVGSVGVLSRGHYDEVSVTRIDYLYVVNCETVVKGDRDDRLHRTLVEELSDFDVCDLHNLFSFPMWRLRVSVNWSSFQPKLCYAYIIHREYYEYSLFCGLFF